MGPVPQKSNPLVSVIILNWNGAEILPRCLEAVSKQTFVDYEIILVDNASEDHSLNDIENRWPTVRIVRLEANMGYAEANNRGARQSKGDWLAFLNNDAFPHPVWLERLVEAMRNHPQYAFFASRIFQADQPELMDSAGDILHTSGSAWHRGNKKPSESFQAEEAEVFSPSGAAAFYNRDAFLKAGAFDADYFSHHEDVDLGFRLRLLGYRCLYIPGAVVSHIGSASFGDEGPTTIYQTQRNMVWTYYKNMPGPLFWRYLPAHIFANLFFLLHYSLKRQIKAVWKAKWDALTGLPGVIKKRSAIQQNMKADQVKIAQVLDHSISGPYLQGSKGKKVKQLLKVESSRQK